jgi:hypothetical protein
MDEDETGYCTYHCAPAKAMYENPATDVSTNLIDWAWNKELWWNETNQDADIQGDPHKSKSGWGYIWLRPEQARTGSGTDS